MASTLQITDGTDTVNLLNTSAGLYLKEKGWKPDVAQEDENGDYLDMIEVITCTWTETTDDDRAETLKTIKRLDRKAREHWRRRKVSDWVWLAAATHSETDTRYAIIKSIDIKELNTGHWGPSQTIEVTLIIKHILWWGIAPTGTPTTVVNAQTIVNKQDADGDNYVAITEANIPGDAPALTIIDIGNDESNILPEFMVALKTGVTADLNNFDPHFNADDELDQSHSADTNAPADVEINRTGVTSWTARWTLPARLDYYRGRYLVYMLGYATVADDVTVRMRIGDWSGLGPKPETTDVSIVTTTGNQYKQHYLGSIEIPINGDIPPNSQSTLPSSYPLRLIFTQSSGTTTTFPNFFLVPIDEGIFVLRRGVQSNVVADGIRQIVYSEVGGTTYVSSLGPLYEGKFIQLVPGRDNRLYFYGSYADASVSYPTYPNPNSPNDEITVTVKIIPRYTSLRGND